MPLCENITCEGAVSRRPRAHTGPAAGRERLRAAGTCAKSFRKKSKGPVRGPLLRDIEQPLARVLATPGGSRLCRRPRRNCPIRQGTRAAEDALRADVFEKAGYTFNVNSPKQMGRGAVREARPAAREKDEKRLVDERFRTRGAALRPPGCRVGAAIPRRRKAEKHVLRRAFESLGAPTGASIRTLTRPRRAPAASARPSQTCRISPCARRRGRELRRFFIAKPGCVLIDADYSQIELRLLAHISGDPAMQKAFCNGEDIHRATAAQVFHMPEDMVTPLMRARAKAVNFGIVYGIGAYSLSRQLHVSLQRSRRLYQKLLSALRRHRRVHAPRRRGGPGKGLCADDVRPPAGTCRSLKARITTCARSASASRGTCRSRAPRRTSLNRDDPRPRTACKKRACRPG